MAKQQNSKKQSRRKDRRTQAPALNRTHLMAALVLAVIGVALAWYATQTTLQIQRIGVVEASGCSINDFVNCDVAHSSTYATFLGIPVAWWGFLFYLWSLLAVAYALRSQDRDAAAGAIGLTWVLSLGAVLFSLYKGFHLFTLGVLCLVCVGMYAVNVGLAIVLLLAFGQSIGQIGSFFTAYINGALNKRTTLRFEPNVKRYGLMALILFGLGYLGMANYTDDITGDAGLDIEQVVRGHFRQQPADINIDPASPAWGTPGAPITVIEFGDFQCPTCKVAATHLRPALFQYRDQVQLHYMHMPLDTTINKTLSRQIHAMAGPAALASVCAAEQGDFWNYHDDIFDNQQTINPGLLLDLAEERGWDRQTFASCMSNPETVARVRHDIEEGVSNGVNATPTVFINGRKLPGSVWRSNRAIHALIEEELDRTD